MFKKDQILQSKRTGKMHRVRFDQDPRFTEYVFVISVDTGRKIGIPVSEMVLIGNNYKEKR